MEMSWQFHAPAAFPPMKEPQNANQNKTSPKMFSANPQHQLTYLLTYLLTIHSLTHSMVQDII
jgi:hypothetical protein